MLIILSFFRGGRGKARDFGITGSKLEEEGMQEEEAAVEDERLHGRRRLWT